MNPIELLNIIEELNIKIKHFDLLQNKRDKFCKKLDQIKADYQSITIDEQYQEVYDSLVNKGNALVENYFRPSMNAKTLSDTINRYLTYLTAAYGDFSGQTSKITGFYRYFLLCSILVLLLSPFILSPIFALVFLLPIFLATRGIKQRSKTGYILSLTVGAAGLITSAMWIKYLFYLILDYATMFQNFITVNAALGQTLCQILIIALPVLGVVLFVLTILFLFRAYKVKDLFVA
ncbi:hypothetical protein [Clostridium facile]|uniref:Alpha-glucosidase n=1 Tax=Clostridium facile TaxID=2763035 RepID=A0ABR7IQL2_9CLOT|nr:hypothetical protein [Clostridium facile]MBC5787435.1 hypothetical protein [Clostridium facile]